MPRVKPVEPLPDPPCYYTLPEAAAIARRSVGALRMLRLRREKTGEPVGPKFIKIDGRLLVSEKELRRWLSGESDSEPRGRTG